ncbi:5'-nucleotidase C-terminal domain-containing protein [uncultured Thiohalocapsa sp.]|uniref:bifunctional metallophosphatase/5'-nucleotidase n=1 Tax=uncultured Thiohalocapsa sp. TaxID=768990 RepID=UPI0025E89F5E|nr:5'-nucleotidase C-terminal domain-containing protein [uncultured Thiohalocapsa sp.]
MMSRFRRFRPHSSTAVLLGLAAGLQLGLAAPQASAASLTLFHNNDGESKLLGSNGFGGFDYFLTELETARNAAIGAGRDVLTLSSGDNFLAGIAFESSQRRRDAVGGIGYGADNIDNNYYDALALATTGYDAITLGNHDFDFGPDVLADFIGGYQAAGGTAPFLSANLDFSGEANLASLVGSSGIAKSTIVSRGSEQYGIIGATTERLDVISSPGNVTINDVATAVQAEINTLEGAGVNKIILSSHLQAIEEEIALAGQLRGVDVIIAGGGDELLANSPDALSSNPFQPNISGPYPTTATDADGNAVPVVTTIGEYRYVGELEVEFNAAGEVTAFNGDPILVDPDTGTAATGTRGSSPAIDIQNDIMVPLQADYDAIAAEQVGSTEVFLDGIRENVRSGETNLGNLIADAFVFSAQQLGTLDADAIVGMTNGGGIRDSINAGNVTNADVISVLPFANSLAVIEDFTVEELLETLNHAVAELPDDDGRFLQVSGIKFEYHKDTNEVVNIYLADGTHLFTASMGVLVGDDFTIDLVTNSFTAGGGDGYDVLSDRSFVDFGISYAEALRRYIRDGLGGTVTGALYGSTEGRIAATPVPATLGILLLGLGALRIVRRRG